MTDTIRVFAHRGGPIRAPANTLCAFKRAIDDGAHGFEFDVALTQDSEPVVIHKAFHTDKISKLIQQDGRLKDLTWSELRDLRTSGERIPHLNDALDFVEHHSIECFVEPKVVSRELTVKIVAAISKRQLENRVSVITFYQRRTMLAEVKKLNAGIKTCVIVLNPLGSWSNKAENATADIIVPGWKYVNHLRRLSRLGLDLKGKITQAQQVGIPVYSGIADTDLEIRWLCTLGVNAIFTNDVPLARSVVAGFQAADAATNEAVQVRPQTR